MSASFCGDLVHSLREKREGKKNRLTSDNIEEIGIEYEMRKGHVINLPAVDFSCSRTKQVHVQRTICYLRTEQSSEQLPGLQVSQTGLSSPGPPVKHLVQEQVKQPGPMSVQAAMLQWFTLENSDGSRISQTTGTKPKGGTSTSYSGHLFSKNCMKLKKNGPRFGDVHPQHCLGSANGKCHTYLFTCKLNGLSILLNMYFHHCQKPSTDTTSRLLTCAMSTGGLVVTDFTCGACWYSVPS